MADASEHRALMILKARSGHKVVTRTTPTPGPRELLIRVSAIALNPIDQFQRDMGLPPINYPAIIGSDIAGVIEAAGIDVADAALQPGCRVAAYAPSFFVKGSPDYGAFQEKVVVPCENAIPLPASLSFSEASLLPMAVQTCFSGFDVLGVPRGSSVSPAEKRGLLVWGAGGSVGSTAVQIGRALGFTVFATASPQHHQYLQGLGARQVFDYRDKNAVKSIVSAAKEEGVSISQAFLATGSIGPSVEVVRQFKPSAGGKPVVAMAPFSFALLWYSLPFWPVTVKFIPSPTTPEATRDHFASAFGGFLRERLSSGAFVPCPKARVVGQGLEAVDPALDEWKKGVSGEKLVVEL